MHGQTTVLTFEDASLTYLSAGYGGLNWAPDEWFAGPQSPPYNAHSGTNTLIDGFFFGTPVGDDFTFHAAVAAVPEPETDVMLLAGLAFLGAQRRRRISRTEAPVE